MADQKQAYGPGDDGDDDGEDEFIEFEGEIPDAGGALAQIDRVLGGKGAEEAAAERNERKKQTYRDQGFCCIEP